MNDPLLEQLLLEVCFPVVFKSMFPRIVYREDLPYQIYLMELFCENSERLTPSYMFDSIINMRLFLPNETWFLHETQHLAEMC